jgi:hypothetical protein
MGLFRTKQPPSLGAKSLIIPAKRLFSRRKDPHYSLSTMMKNCAVALLLLVVLVCVTEGSTHVDKNF